MLAAPVLTGPVPRPALPHRLLRFVERCDVLVAAFEDVSGRLRITHTRAVVASAGGRHLRVSGLPARPGSPVALRLCAGDEAWSLGGALTGASLHVETALPCPAATLPPPLHADRSSRGLRAVDRGVLERAPWLFVAARADGAVALDALTGPWAALPTDEATVLLAEARILPSDVFCALAEEPAVALLAVDRHAAVHVAGRAVLEAPPDGPARARRVARITVHEVRGQ